MPRPGPSKSAAPTTRTIVCVYCRKPQTVGSTAMSLPCRFCHKALNLEDVLIAGYAAKRVIETCGAITIEQKGDVTMNSLACASLSLAGKLKGNVVCMGAVSIAASATLRGDVTAPVVHIIPGARLEGHYTIGGDSSGRSDSVPRKSKPPP